MHSNLPCRVGESSMPDIDGRIVLAALVAVIGVGIWVGRMTEFKSATTKRLEEILQKIDRIIERLPPALLSTGSPLRLTELGRKISDALDAPRWLEPIAASLQEQAANKSAYEIQKLCFDYMVDTFDPDPTQDAEIKECAYENGIEVKGVLDVLAVELRDKLLGGRAPPPTPQPEPPPLPPADVPHKAGRR